MPWIKICGTTNLEDALAAVEAGADAVGFIFTDSPRRITPEKARDIVANLPDSIQKIGVFVNASPQRLQNVVEKVGLTGIQLHGTEDEKYLERLYENWAKADPPRKHKI